MNLNFFNKLENTLINSKNKNYINNFLNELNEFLKNDNKLNKHESKYDKYWEYQNFIEDKVSAKIGLSRWSNDVTYHDELSSTINNSILELSKTEGTLYRKQFSPNGPLNNAFYNIEKFENNKIEHLTLPISKIPNKYENKDIIFEIKKDGKIKIRNDLMEKTIEIASIKCSSLKILENEKSINFKQEGHIYKAIEDDGYIFLKDITQDGKKIIEDIDFVVNNYKGDGLYKVINGNYEKIEE